MVDDVVKPSRESFSTTEIPPRPIRQIAAEAAADVEVSIQRLTDWGVKVDRNSRLHQALTVLRHAIATGALVPKHRGDQLGLRALEIAFDYGAIARTLPKIRIAALRREIGDSLKGPIDPPENARGPLQLQSQGIARAAFVLAGLSPTHPTHSPKLGRSSPDLILENGLGRYAVEIKRPQLTKNVEVRFDEGRDQLVSFGVQGGVLVDVTDCVRGLTGEAIGKEVRRLALGLYARTFVTGRGHKPGYTNIMMAGTFARVAWNSQDGDLVAMVQVHTSSTIGIFAQTRNSLVDHRARWIRKGFEDGLERLNRTLSEA